MNTAAWLSEAQNILEKAGIATARLDCLVLLEDETTKERGWLLANQEHTLQIEIIKKLNKKIEQRARHEPLAYIRNKTEFYGREFYIDHHVLEPRPESETMIDTLKQLTLPSGSTIADIGTGSGALAIIAKLELPKINLIATDIDLNCLKVATKNAKKHNTNIKFLQGDLLGALPPPSSHSPKTEPLVVLCNLPYVPDDFQINPAAMREPHIAIFGGFDGLDLYRKLFSQIKTISSKPRYILTEALPPQHQQLGQIAQEAGCKLIKTNDFIQLFRTDSEYYQSDS